MRVRLASVRSPRDIMGALTYSPFRRIERLARDHTMGDSQKTGNYPGRRLISDVPWIAVNDNPQA